LLLLAVDFILVIDHGLIIDILVFSK